jgi:predicted RNA-binding Zn-ribbon protein involved in translation (DUF1610 family)
VAPAWQPPRSSAWPRPRRSSCSQAPAKPQDDKPKDDPENKDDKKADDNSEAASERASTTETKRDADGNPFRECPQCGHNMYQQGRTWTCENCGYSYIE